MGGVHQLDKVVSYQIPRIDVNVGGTYKHQTDTPWGRILTLTEDADGDAFNQENIAIFAEPRDTFRFPAIENVDFRASKFFNVGRHRLEAIMDVFNLANANTVTSFNVNPGEVFQNPLNVYGPRVVLFGARWTFQPASCLSTMTAPKGVAGRAAPFPRSHDGEGFLRWARAEDRRLASETE